MAPLPDNNTMRVWMDYTSGGVTHSLLMRFAGNAAPTADDRQRAENIGNAALGVMADTDAIVGWRYSVKGTNFSLPLGVPLGNGTQAGGTINDESRTCFVGVAARSLGGRRYFADFFTIVAYSFSIYRDDYASLPANFQALHDAFVGIDVPPGSDLVAIDEQGVIFKDYLNIGQHAYWQRAQR